MSDLLSRIETALSKCPQIQGKNIQVTIVGGHIILRGVVSSYYAKQMAQVSVLPLSGLNGLKIVNKIEVSKEGEY